MQPEPDWAAWEAATLRTVGGALKDARTRAGMSQRALADAAGVDRGQIVNLESAGRTSELPRIGLLIRLAVALHVPPISLLYPGLPDRETEVLPGVTVRAIEATKWFSGEAESHRAEELEYRDDMAALAWFSREWDDYRRSFEVAVTDYRDALDDLRGQPTPEGVIPRWRQLSANGLVRHDFMAHHIAEVLTKGLNAPVDPSVLDRIDSVVRELRAYAASIEGADTGTAVARLECGGLTRPERFDLSVPSGRGRVISLDNAWLDGFRSRWGIDEADECEGGDDA